MAPLQIQLATLSVRLYISFTLLHVVYCDIYSIMINDSLAKALAELAYSDERPVAARLREIYPQIETAIECGATRKQVLKVLNQNGFQLELNVFVTNLHRLRKINKRQHQPSKTSARPIKAVLGPTVKPVARPDTSTAGGTNPLRGLAEAELQDSGRDPRRDSGLPFGRRTD